MDMDRSLVIWGLILALGVPIVVVLMSEILERLERKEHPLSKFVRLTRNYILPILVVLLVVRKLYNVEEQTFSLQLLESILLGVAIVATITFVNNVLSTNKERLSWQIPLPNLFFQFVRAGAVAAIAAYLLEGVWGVNLSEVAGALGIGSVALAFALQETISSLVSGFLLLIAKPFTIGDYIHVGDISGRVTDINWRSVTLQHQSTINVIPNGSLSGAEIRKSSREKFWYNVEANFTYSTPPNRILEVLPEAIAELPDADSPWPEVLEYDAEGIKYALWFMCLPEKSYAARAVARARLYYIAKRYELTFAYPIGVEYEPASDAQAHFDRNLEPNHQPDELQTFIRTVPMFANLDAAGLERLAGGLRFCDYGNREPIVPMGEPDGKLYIVVNGIVRIAVLDIDDELQSVFRLARGDIFGELALSENTPSPIAARAAGDVRLVVAERDAIVWQLRNNPRFAAEMGQLIEDRKRLVRKARGLEVVASQNNGSSTNTSIGSLFAPNRGLS